MYNLHIFFEEIEILQLVTHKCMYVDVNSKITVLAEREELKSCICRAGTANIGMVL